MIGRVVFAVACVFSVAGCTKEESHPAYASGTCPTPPCGGATYRTGGGGVIPDAGADAAEERD